MPVLYLFVNSEPASFYQASTDNFINTHRNNVVCNDYISPTVANGVVRKQFQNDGVRPVVVVINGVAGSPTHDPWELLVNYGGYSDLDFGPEISQWRARIDSVRPAPPPPPTLSQPRWNPDGSFQFLVSGHESRRYRVEGTGRFDGWTTILTNVAAGASGVPVRDTNAALIPYRFYRAVEE